MGEGMSFNMFSIQPRQKAGYGSSVWLIDVPITDNNIQTSQQNSLINQPDFCSLLSRKHWWTLTAQTYWNVELIHYTGSNWKQWNNFQELF